MGIKVLVTPRSFGKQDPIVFDMLRDAGVEIVPNDTGTILSREAMQERIRDCEGVIIGVDPLDALVINAAPHLRAIAKYGTGMDNIDQQAAKARGIKISNTVGANSDAVADYAFALILALGRQVIGINEQCHRRDWKKVITSDVSGKTIGILGFGEIGKRVAARAHGFSMKILAYDVIWDETWTELYHAERTDADRIFREADYISLHMPLLPQTRGFVNRERLAIMKPTAYLINTARGELVMEDALLEVLLERRIAGAGLDAFREEPPQDDIWYTLDNVIMGSHCAASTPGATRNMGRFAVQNLLRDLDL